MGEEGAVEPYPLPLSRRYSRCLRPYRGSAFPELGVVPTDGRASCDEVVLESVVMKGEALSRRRTVDGRAGCSFRISFWSKGIYSQLPCCRGDVPNREV